MTAVRAQTEGGVAAAEGGVVVLDGPDGVAVAMTPDAADATARSLSEAASVARTQGEGDAQG